ncbi:Pxp2 protein [Maudiozyma humilis]|uniref:Pxp2 protein n=1 Tax=Maudiozyma humilis TaxID=51915 RepID=A0AAV5RYH6_MAUHU|nr:Pxp2 protein [Kazachstania humilis]
MRSILNAQRLLQLYQFNPKLKDIWYLAAAATFSVANQPQEIPKLFHYAMLLSNENSYKFRVTLAYKTMEMLNEPEEKRSAMINEIYEQPTDSQRRLSARFRETLLKTGALAGLPRAINGLSTLKQYTPKSLLPETKEIDVWNAAMGLADPCPQDGTLRKQMRDTQDVNEVMHRGLDQWNMIYNKVSNRVVNNLNSSYPDLWYFTLMHVYGPLFSFDKILSKQETSLVVISSLVPQDVNPQLRGHLKGALNVGCDNDTVEAVRRLSILVSQWCNIKWSDGIVGLLPPKTRKQN